MTQKRQTPLFTALVLTICLLLGACTAKKTENLLDWAPGDAAAIVNVTPKQAFAATGLQPSPDEMHQSVEALLSHSGLSIADSKQLADFLTTHGGLSTDQFVMVCAYNGDKTVLCKVADHKQFIAQFDKKEWSESEAHDLMTWKSNTGTLGIGYATDPGVALITFNADAPKSGANALHKLMEQVDKTPLASWQRQRLDGSNALTALVNTKNLLGLDLSSMANTPYASLLGSDVEYAAIAVNTTKQSLHINVETLTAEGKSADAFNPSLAKDTDFSAANLLPADLPVAVTLGVGADRFTQLVPPMLRNNANISNILANVKSIALGLHELSDIKDLTDITELKGALVIKYTTGSNVDASLKQMLYGNMAVTQLPGGGVRYQPPFSDNAQYLYSRPDAMMISSEPAEFAAADEFAAPEGALATCMLRRSEHGLKDGLGVLKAGSAELTFNFANLQEFIKYLQHASARDYEETSEHDD